MGILCPFHHFATVFHSPFCRNRDVLFSPVLYFSPWLWGQRIFCHIARASPFIAERYVFGMGCSRIDKTFALLVLMDTKNWQCLDIYRKSGPIASVVKSFIEHGSQRSFRYWERASLLTPYLGVICGNLILLKWKVKYSNLFGHRKW